MMLEVKLQDQAKWKILSSYNFFFLILNIFNKKGISIHISFIKNHVKKKINKYFNNFIPIKKQKVFNEEDSDLTFSETGREKTLKD